MASLPDPVSYGEVPVLSLLPAAAPGAPGPAVLDSGFWELVERHVPPVPRAQPGHEAEAPWVRRRRRVQPLRGHGMVTDDLFCCLWAWGQSPARVRLSRLPVCVTSDRAG